jgi:bifunctional UDP-N-acetylglucosamine pyrophosphorylase/glucosamine-1-phosphate N-acetyltransferase
VCPVIRTARRAGTRRAPPRRRAARRPAARHAGERPTSAGPHETGPGIPYHQRVSAVVVIMAAGKGTRMRSGTPKLLHSLCGRPMIAWPVAAALEAGVGQVVVVDSAGGELRAALGDEVAVAVQDEARGTADAVRAAAAHFTGAETVVVINGDHPLITSATVHELVQARQESGAAAVIGTAVLEDPSGYGRVVRGPDGTVERVVETKSPGDATELQLHIREVNAGLYAFDAAELVSALGRVGSENVQGEMYLPDVLPILRDDERTVVALELSDVEATLGVNDRAALAQVRGRLQQRIHEAHMLAGVTIVNPGCTVIDAGVEIEAEAAIAPFTSLHGTTRVGAGSTVGPLSTLIDTRVGAGAAVVHSYTKEAEIGDRVSVGPFAYLRPGTVLREGAKAGTFVEIKNSDIGAGTKVPHLSYIGDADVGEDTNLGAATITANYDGTRKHRTTIGSRVKTSVDTTLVAPVTVGDDAYTAAGSVIGQDVPPGALAGSPGVSKTEQRNVEGYSERRKEREADDEPPATQDYRRQADVNSAKR